MSLLLSCGFKFRPQSSYLLFQICFRLLLCTQLFAGKLQLLRPLPDQRLGGIELFFGCCVVFCRSAATSLDSLPNPATQRLTPGRATTSNGQYCPKDRRDDGEDIDVHRVGLHDNARIA